MEEWFGVLKRIKAKAGYDAYKKDRDGSDHVAVPVETGSLQGLDEGMSPLIFWDVLYSLRVGGYSDAIDEAFVAVRNPPGVFLSGNSGHVHVPGEVPPGTLRVRSHAPGPLGSRPPPANS